MLLIGLLHFVIVRLCLSNLFTKCFLHEASVHDVSDRPESKKKLARRV